MPLALWMLKHSVWDRAVLYDQRSCILWPNVAVLLVAERKVAQKKDSYITKSEALCNRLSEA